jgi:hypothetical protein
MTFGQRMPDFYPQRDAGDVTRAEALTRTAGTFLRASAGMLPPDGASLATQPRLGARAGEFELSAPWSTTVLTRPVRAREPLSKCVASSVEAPHGHPPVGRILALMANRLRFYDESRRCQR